MIHTVVWPDNEIRYIKYIQNERFLLKGFSPIVHLYFDGPLCHCWTASKASSFGVMWWFAAELSSAPPHQPPDHVLSGPPLGWVFNDRALTFLTRTWVRGLIRPCVLWIGLILLSLSANTSGPGSRHASYQPYRATLSNTDRPQLCCWLTSAGGYGGGLVRGRGKCRRMRWCWWPFDTLPHRDKKKW